ncbi:hypothetical protein [Stutzerimonas marianensis]
MEQAIKADVPSKAISAIAAAMSSHTSMATKLLSDESTRDVVLTVVHELLKRMRERICWVQLETNCIRHLSPRMSASSPTQIGAWRFTKELEAQGTSVAFCPC